MWKSKPCIRSNTNNAPPANTFLSAEERIRKLIFRHVWPGCHVSLRHFSIGAKKKKKRQITGGWQRPLPARSVCALGCQVGGSSGLQQEPRWHGEEPEASEVRAPPWISCRRAWQQRAASRGHSRQVPPLWTHYLFIYLSDSIFFSLLRWLKMILCLFISALRSRGETFILMILISFLACFHFKIWNISQIAKCNLFEVSLVHDYCGHPDIHTFDHDHVDVDCADWRLRETLSLLQEVGNISGGDPIVWLPTEGHDLPNGNA